MSLDRDWRYVFVNRRAGELFSRRPEDLIGKHIWTEFPEGENESFAHAYRIALEDQSPARIEEFYPPWNRWFENRIYPHPRGIDIFFTEITDRKLAELALRDAEERLRLAVGAANVGLWDWDLVTNEVHFSPEWKRQLGYGPDEIPNRFEEWEKRVHPDDVVPTLTRTRAFIADPGPIHEAEFRLRHRDGSYRWILARANVLKDRSGKPVRMLGCHVDLTEHRRAQDAVREGEARLRLAVEATGLSLFERDARTGELRYGDVLRAALDYTREDFPDRFDAFVGLMHPDDRPRFVSEVDTGMASNLPRFETEYRLRHRDGSYRWILSRVSTVVDEHGEPLRYIGGHMDITERRRAEEEHERVVAALRRSEVLAALGALIGGVAHEVRTPLFGITATLDAMEARLGEHGTHSKYVEALRGEARRLEELMRDLLDYSRPGSPVRVRVRLGDAVEEAVRACTAEVGTDRHVRVRIPDDLPELTADPTRLTVALRNLVHNALEHSPQHGTVVVEGKAIEDGRGPGVECSISDGGPGFRDEDLPHLFEPFFSRRAGGTGLGLSIVRRVVEELAGEVAAENRTGGGATVRIWLPVGR